MLSAETRTSVKSNHALIAPDGWVDGALPGWTNGDVYTIISDRMGAGFNQLLIFLNTNGTGSGNTSSMEYFIYVMEGTGSASIDQESAEISKGDFIFIPPNSEFRIACEQHLKLTIFQKTYQQLEGHNTPKSIFGKSLAVPANEYLDDPQLKLQTLLPDNLSFDMAVNIFTYEPGGHLPFVETHVMEHGLIYLQGQGIYRMSDHWYPVTTDDCIWMAPYCPQWFVAMGKVPAVYLYYKNVNRLP